MKIKGSLQVSNEQPLLSDFWAKFRHFWAKTGSVLILIISNPNAWLIPRIFNSIISQVLSKGLTCRLFEKSMYTVSRKRHHFFVKSPTKLRRCWRNPIHRFLNKFAAKWLNVYHFIWIMSLYYTLWNFKCSLRTCYHWVVTERNSRIYPTANVASKFARFESSW